MKEEQNKAALKALEDVAADQDKNAPIREREEAEAKAKAELEARPPIICLGEEGTRNVYWSRVNNRLYQLSPNEHRPAFLLRMAKLQDFALWLFPDYNAEQIENNSHKILAAVGMKLLEGTAGAQFDSSRLRARGFWKDDETGGIIYNAGDACFLSTPDAPAPVKVENVRGRFIYDAGVPTPHPSKEPLSFEEGEVLNAFLNARTWGMNESGEHLLGWIACSLLAGAIPFRPHVWINAPANTGKTYLRDDLLPLFGGMAITLDGAESTEAALRAELNGAALPVIWDEMEQDAGDRRKKENIDRCKALIRNATKGGIIKKGTQGGGAAKAYYVKAGFLLFSIAHSLDKDSDMSRFLCLRLTRAGADEIDKLKPAQEAGRELTRQKGFTARLIARLIQEYPAIIENMGTLEKHLRSQGVKARQAEMMAALVAGAHAIRKGGAVDEQGLNKALLYCTRINEQEDHQSEPERAIAWVMEFPIAHDKKRVTLGQLIRMVREQHNNADPDAKVKQEIEEVAIVLQGFSLGWYTPSQNQPNQLEKKGEQYLRMGTSTHTMKRLFDGTEWAHGRIVPVFMDGGKVNEISPLGIICVKKEKGKQTVLLFPDVLLFPELQGENEEESP